MKHPRRYTQSERIRWLAMRVIVWSPPMRLLRSGVIGVKVYVTLTVVQTGVGEALRCAQGGVTVTQLLQIIRWPSGPMGEPPTTSPSAVRA